MTEPQMSSLPEHRILTCDWKAQFKASELDQAAREVFDGKNPPRFFDLDTGSDSCGMVVAAASMTPEQVKAAWTKENNGE